MPKATPSNNGKVVTDRKEREASRAESPTEFDPPKPAAPLTEPEGRTDIANAARLVARHGAVVRWVGPWNKWLIWDGKRWKRDQALGIDLKAKNIAADLFAEIAVALKEDWG